MPAVTYVLFLLLRNNPYPIVGMVEEFPTKAECHEFIVKMEAPPEAKERLVCQGMVIDDMSQPENKKPAPAPVPHARPSDKPTKKIEI